jgi:hypothetical protein
VLCKQQREAKLSKWQQEQCEARVGGEHTCTICQELIEGDAGALGCAEGVAGAAGCAGRFCSTCLPMIQARIVAGKQRTCPSCRWVEPPTGPGGAEESLRLCRDFYASRTDNAFESIALPPPPRDESAREDDAQMAARLQEEEAAWLREQREARRHRLEESDARSGHGWEQERAQGLAQRSGAAAARAARGAEGGSSTAAVRLQREAEGARTGGAAGGGGSSSLSSRDATSTALQSVATPPPTTTTPNATTPAAAPQHDAVPAESAAIGGADDAAIDSDVQPAGSLNLSPSPNHYSSPNIDPEP